MSKTRLMKAKLGYLLHWIGLIGTCFMLMLSFLDQGQDELIIQLIATSWPLLCMGGCLEFGW